MLRVAFDEQIFLLQQAGGVSRYFVELVAQFDTGRFGVQPKLPFHRVWNQHALDGLPEHQLTAVSPLLAPYPDLLRAAARRRRPSAGVDLVHHTFYHPRFLRDFPGIPKVITIYDLIPELLGERGRFGRDPHMAKRDYLAAADAIILISASAEADMVRIYGQPAAPMHVVHLGVGPEFAAGGARPAGLPADYVLFVGRRGGYKDFATLVRAMEQMAPDYPQLDLVCVGGGPFTPEEGALLAASGLDARTRQCTLPDADMPGAYAHARVFVFPSRYEGFGLPVVEAMAAGAPAVLAQTPALAEVGGDAAAYFPAGDADRLTQVLAELLADGARRDELKTAGRRRAQHFTWAETARRTADVYAEVVAAR
ncbi:MAG: glycosyltransferase family 1 protein [Actinobacteria bacterium]|nr:MAG: glycosyltransferase family 1 protein [Actinomycetota bacterium]